MSPETNAEKLRRISRYFKDGVAELEQDAADSSYNFSQNDHAFDIARRAIEQFMPELVALTNERVRVGSELGICLSRDKREQDTHEGISVLATFRAIEIQSSIERMEISDGDITFTNYDLCALFIPKFVDPDPVDIVFGGELFVPFGRIEEFTAA